MSGRAVRAGRAEVEIGIRSRIEQGLATAQKKLSEFGKGVAVSGGAAFGASAGILAPLLMAASDAAETASKFDIVFGKQSEAVRGWGDEFAGQVGRSKNEIAGFLSSSQDLLVPMGVDPAAAQEMSKTLTKLSVDLGSFNNVADADAMNDLQAALTGSGEVMKKYGVIVSEATVGQELLNKGLDPKTATEAEKAQARLAVILAGTSAAQGDAIRTSGGFANQMKALTSTAADLAVSVGDVLLPPATAFLQLVNRGARWVLDLAERNKGLIAAVGGVVAIVGAGGAILASLGGFAVAASVAIGFISSALGVMGAILAAIAWPALAIVGVIAAIGAAAYLYRDAIMEYGQAFWDTVKPARDALAEIWSLVTTTLGGIYDALSAGDIQGAGVILWTGLQAIFFSGVESIEQLFEWMFGAATGWLKGIGDAVLSGNFSTAWEIAWAQIVLWFTQGTTTVTRLWSYFVFGLGDTFGEVFSGLRSVFYSVMGSISAGLEATVGKLRELLTAIADYDPTGLAAKTSAALSVASLAYGSAGDEFNRLQEQEAKDREVRSRDRYKALEGRLADADAELAARQADADAAIAKAADERGGLTEAMSVAKRKELEALVANFAESDAVASDDQLPDTGGAERVARSTSAIGSFSAVAASILGRGSGSAVEETARHTRETAAQTKLMNGKLQQLVERPADGGAAFA